MCGIYRPGSVSNKCAGDSNMNNHPVITVSLLLASILAISSCSGGSSGSGSQPPPSPPLDTTPPVITLLGNNPQEITTGATYTELGATAMDNVDGDISGSIVIDSSAVDTSSADSYPVTYNVTDSSGNTADTVIRTVTVQDPPPPASPETDVQRVFDQLTFNLPVALMQAPGDNSRWFVVEKSGVVRVFDNDPNVSSSSVFIDIRGRVDSGPNEAGLLGMAFHPDFAANDQVYLSYTRTGSPLVSVISRFLVDPATGDLDETSEFEILTVPQEFSNHNGGNIAFGPEPGGNLYIGFGDGGGGGDPNERAQDTSHILGSIVRLDVDVAPPTRYAIPATNPFSLFTNCVDGVGVMPCPEIYAWGFRNPWRFSFDSQTGELWVGDVGQGGWEEVDRVELGLNYGWNEREGAHCFEPPSGCSTNNVDPITEYGHVGGNFSITGGFVYRGAAIPNLQGFYVFGDFGSGRIWGVPATSVQGTAPEELDDTTLSISSFAEGANGELYVLNYGAGEIYQIVDAP